MGGAVGGAQNVYISYHTDKKKTHTLTTGIQLIKKINKYIKIGWCEPGLMFEKRFKKNMLLIAFK